MGHLEHIVLSGSSLSQKAAGCVVPLIGNVQKRQIHGDRKDIRGCPVLGQMGWGVSAVSF